jgi:hypothetical protein
VRNGRRQVSSLLMAGRADGRARRRALQAIPTEIGRFGRFHLTLFNWTIRWLVQLLLTLSLLI